MRMELIDGLRGHLLIMMMLAHLSWQDQMGFMALAHHAKVIGLFDAEFLVVLSGLLVGILYTIKFRTSARLAEFLRSRMVKIYRYYLLSAVPFILFAVAAAPAWAPGAVLRPVLEVLLVQNGGAYSDILPIYLYCFALLLAGALTVLRFGAAALLPGSALIYVISLFDYSRGFFGLSGAFMVFDVAAWQFLFFLSFVAGAWYRRILDVLCAMDPRLFGLLLLALLALAGLQRDWTGYAPFGTLPDGAPDNWARMQLHPLYLLRIVEVSAFFAVLLGRPARMTAPLRRVLEWYLTLRLVRLIGQWSIQMFVLHVYLMAVYAMLADRLSFAERAILEVGLMALFLAAPLLAFGRRRAAAP